MSPVRSRLVQVSLLAAVLLFALAEVRRAHSYLLMGDAQSGNFSPDKWTTIPIPIQISTNIAPGAKLRGSTSFQTVITNSLATWNQAPNFQTPLGSPVLDTLTAPKDGVNLICFCTSGGVFDSGDGTLAVTVTTIRGTQIIGANIFFNPQPDGVCFATDGNVGECSNPSDSVQDLQTVATHEIGHLIGMDHSAVVRAMMFPFAPDRQTELGWDDVAAASQLYPKPAADVPTGAISGNVTLNQSPVFGAHVFASSVTGENPFGGFPKIRKTPVGILSDANGNYTIQGLPPDAYEVIAEPLDGPVTDSNVDWANDFGKTAVQTNFTSRWH